MSEFEFHIDEKVQAFVEGRILSRKDSRDRENEYLVEYDLGNGHKHRRWFPEHELDVPVDDAAVVTSNVVPFQAA